MADVQPIKIAIMALGGQGGGVLADWIVRLGERSGYLAQSTSVPGVAQRTGATIYYVELFPKNASLKKGKPPILALMPAPGDVDIVLAAELMEAGRAVTRGLVTNQTTLIASTHRDYAIAEKIALGDGRLDPNSISSAAKKSAGRAIVADMSEAATSVGANISASMFGALAGSNALPISREAFEDTIRETGRAIESNLKAFEKGFAVASSAPAPEVQLEKNKLQRRSPSSAASLLLNRMRQNFPTIVQDTVQEGLKRIVDYQDVRYGEKYLDRLESVFETDRKNEGELHDWRLTKKLAKHLALWMSYEDAIRVADLKTRSSRFERFRDDVKATPEQIVHVSEYLHPRVEEICDLLPSRLATMVLNSSAMRKIVNSLLGGGRRISTTKLRGFLPLYFMASLRFMRRNSYRFKVEKKRIEEWLSIISIEAQSDYELACEIAALQRLIKGYGDTHARGIANFSSILSALSAVKRQDNSAHALVMLRDAALADEDGVKLQAALAKLDHTVEAA